MPAVNFRASVAGGRSSMQAMIVVACLLLHLTASEAAAQFAVGGVYIDTKGMLRHTSTLAPDERLELIRAESFDPPGSTDLGANSELRKVSLRRLEARVQELLSADKPLPVDIRYLAGLQRVSHVLFYPEIGDVVVAGPAEGWKQLPTGEVVGIKSNRPALQLDDLLVALRFAFDDTPVASFIGCSIEPTAGGIKNYAAYMRKIGRIDRSRVQQLFAGMEQAMGPQAVKLYGVPGESRFASKLVAADYRLKRIALGHDPSPVKGVTNYLDLAAKRLRPGRQRQHRWWFVGGYDAVFHTADQLAFELDGQGVRVSTAPTAVTAGSGNAKKSKSPLASPAARKFAAAMTRNFPQIASKIPIFAELQNLIGLSVAAELIAERHRVDSHSWKPTTFADKKSCPIQEVPVPTMVPSLANFRLVKNRHWLISISGGVEINPRAMTGRTVRQEAPAKRKLQQTLTGNRPTDNSARWWWD